MGAFAAWICSNLGEGYSLTVVNEEALSFGDR